MIALTDAFATSGVALVLCAGVLRLAYASKTLATMLRYPRSALAGLLLLILLWPALTPISLAAYVRGISSDLSITLVVLSVWSLLESLKVARPMHQHEFAALMFAVAAGALILYPAALGWGDWDAYRLGWSSWLLWAALMVLSAVCWFAGLVVLPSLMALAMLAWAFNLMESNNLWDYLLDAWLSFYALGFVFIKFWRTGRQRFNKLDFHN